MNNHNSKTNCQSIQTGIESILNEMPLEVPPANEPRPNITISVFRGMTDTDPEVFENTFEALAEECRTPEIRGGKDGLAFCPAVFEPQYRKKENARECAVLVYDLDNLPQGIDAEMALSCIRPYNGFCYSTFSHKADGKGNRYRVVVELAEPIPAAEYKRIAGIFAVNFPPCQTTCRVVVV